MRLAVLLDNPLAWEATRRGLDLTFGLYRRRIELLRDWGFDQPEARTLDLGCGIGHYATAAHGDYLGIDLNERYVAYARHRHGSERRRFLVLDLRDLRARGEQFDYVLMVDSLHHLPSQSCIDLLGTVRTVAKNIVSFEPVSDQPRRLGRWIIKHDRGNHVRPLRELEALFAEANCEIVESRALYLGPINTRAIRSTPPTASGRGG
jgi:SAM-dependent methyltransferase